MRIYIADRISPPTLICVVTGGFIVHKCSINWSFSKPCSVYFFLITMPLFAYGAGDLPPRVSFEEELGEYCQMASGEGRPEEGVLRSKVLTSFVSTLVNSTSIAANLPLGTFMNSDAPFQAIEDFCRMVKTSASSDFDEIYQTSEQRKSAAQLEYDEAKNKVTDPYAPIARLLALTQKMASGIEDIVVEKARKPVGQIILKSRLYLQPAALSPDMRTDLATLIAVPSTAISPTGSLQDSTLMLRDIEEVRVRLVGYALEKNDLRRCLSSVVLESSVDSESHQLPLSMAQSIIGWGADIERMSLELQFRQDLIEEYRRYIEAIIQASVTDTRERQRMSSLVREFIQYRKIGVVPPEVDPVVAELAFASACNSSKVPSFDLWAMQNPQTYPPQLELDGFKLSRTLKVCGLHRLYDDVASPARSGQQGNGLGSTVSMLESAFASFSNQRYGMTATRNFAADWGAPAGCSQSASDTPICVVRRIDTLGKAPQAGQGSLLSTEDDVAPTETDILSKIQNAASKATGNFIKPAGITNDFIRKIFQRLNTSLEELTLLRASVAEINIKRGFHKQAMIPSKQCQSLLAKSEGANVREFIEPDRLASQIYRGDKYLPSIITMQRMARESYEQQARKIRVGERRAEIVNTLNFIQRIMARKNAQENDILSQSLKERSFQVPKGR